MVTVVGFPLNLTSYWITSPFCTVLPEEGFVTVTVMVFAAGVGDGESDAAEEGVGEAAATVAAAAIKPSPASASPRNRMAEVRVDAAVVLASSIIGPITAQ